MSQHAVYPSAADGTVSIAAVGTNGSAIPTSSIEIGVKDGSGNLQPVIQGQATMAASLPVVISSNQSAVPASQSGTWNVTNVSGTVSLPTGASTAANQTTGNTSLASIDGKTPALGSTTMSGSVPVTLATDMLPIANTSILYSSITNANYDITCAGYTTVTIQSIGGFTTATFTIKGSNDGTNFVNLANCFNLINQSTGAVYTNASIFLVVPCGGFKVVRCVATSVTGGPPNLQFTAANGANLTSVYSPSAAQFLATANIKDSNGNNLLQGQQTMANSLGVTIASNQSNVPANIAQINGVTPLMGNGVTGTGSLRVTLASDTSSNTNPLLTAETVATTSAVTSVASSASTVSLLALNASRKGATFFNDSSTTLYLKLGATASLTSFTVQIPGGGYYELPFGKIYTGAIDGIWSAANGNVRITELS